MTSEGCGFCIQRKAGQLKYIQQIEESFPYLNKVEVPLFTEEIKGIEALIRLKSFLFNELTH